MMSPEFFLKKAGADSAVKEPGSAASGSAGSVHVRQAITIKTLVTEEFKRQAVEELRQELSFIQEQLDQLDAQFQQAQKQLEELAKTGQSVLNQMEQLNQEMIGRKQQLSGLKMEVTSQLSTIEKANNGTYIVTGQLEGVVPYSAGDNLYDKIRNTEILIKDGVITSILG